MSVGALLLGSQNRGETRDKLLSLDLVVLCNDNVLAEEIELLKRLLQE